MEELKNRVAYLVKTYTIAIIIPVTLSLTAISDWWLGLLVYCIIIHTGCIAYVAGLYDPNFLTKVRRARINPPYLLYLLFLFSASLIVLGARGHWYLFIVTIVTYVLMFVHVIDALLKARKNHGNGTQTTEKS